MPTSDERGLLDELITVRDWLRYAVTSMTRANLVTGDLKHMETHGFRPAR